MATRGERLPQEVIDHQCEAVAVVESLRQEWNIVRHPQYRAALENVRREILEANMAACRTWFGGDTLSDLPDGKEAA